ncbi:MAG TPA: exonuclease [Desulfobacteraceae bacterium]|nr:exonuclease [Desulfobacteraceae bacterium]
MHVTFYGAAREVTGSMHLITTETDRILLDCGMFQGRRKEAAQKNSVLPFDPNIISNIVLSHAHIDHSGRIPMLTSRDFHGQVVCTRATADACKYLLPDSAHIQESDAYYLNYKTVRAMLRALKTSPKGTGISPHANKNIQKMLKTNKNKLNTAMINELMAKYHLESVEPLYTTAAAEQALGFFNGYPYKTPFTIGHDVTCTFYDAGHILGSAFSLIKIRENGKSYNILYTGDIGRFGSPIIKNPTMTFPEEDRVIDLLIMESTYGNRLHEPMQDQKKQLKDVINSTFERKGTVIIPSFAFGRTQELLYTIHELYDNGDVPHFPVYVDSPLSTHLTKVYGEHPEVYDKATNQTFLQQGKNPFLFEQLRFISAVEESMALMREEKSHIVIASAGMCEAGRILHHLRNKIHNPRHTVLIVGYMAQNTLGRRILEQGREYAKSGRRGSPPLLKFLNKVYPLKAHVEILGGFSAHADNSELLRFVTESNLKIKKTAVVHGEEDQALAFAKHLEKKGLTAFVPRAGDMAYV